MLVKFVNTVTNLKQKDSGTLEKGLLLSALGTYCTEQLTIGLENKLWFYDYCCSSSHVLDSIVQLSCSADNHNYSVYFKLCEVWGINILDFPFLLLTFVAKNFVAVLAVCNYV